MNDVEPGHGCLAHGCAEPLETPHAEFCLRHSRLTIEFRMWLANRGRRMAGGDRLDSDPSDPLRSFDAARAAWERVSRGVR